MNIEKIEVGFTNMINIGRCAYIIVCKKDGAFMPIEELVENGQGFNFIVIKGDDPLFQKAEIAKFCKKIIKINPRIRIDIFTNAFDKPVEISGYANNATFYVCIPDKTNPRYKIDIVILSWFSELGANFIFDIKNLDDIDNAVVIMNSSGIKKSQAFLKPLQQIDKLNRQVKFYGINLAPQVEWDDDE